MAHRVRRSAASTRPGLAARTHRAAISPAAKAVYIAIGAAGLTGLAIAIFGSRRFERVIVQPVRTAVSDQAEKLWAEASPLRTQLVGLIERAASETGREKLIRNFQSWIGHFRAS